MESWIRICRANRKAQESRGLHPQKFNPIFARGMATLKSIHKTTDRIAEKIQEAEDRLIGVNFERSNSFGTTRDDGTFEYSMGKIDKTDLAAENDPRFAIIESVYQNNVRANEYVREVTPEI